MIIFYLCRDGVRRLLELNKYVLVKLLSNAKNAQFHSIRFPWRSVASALCCLSFWFAFQNYWLKIRAKLATYDKAKKWPRSVSRHFTFLVVNSSFKNIFSYLRFFRLSACGYYMRRSIVSTEKILHHSQTQPSIRPSDQYGPHCLMRCDYVNI